MREFVDSIEVGNTDLALEIALALSRLLDDNGDFKYEIVIRPYVLDMENRCVVDVYKGPKC